MFKKKKNGSCRDQVSNLYFLVHQPEGLHWDNILTTSRSAGTKKRKKRLCNKRMQRNERIYKNEGIWKLFYFPCNEIQRNSDTLQSCLCKWMHITSSQVTWIANHNYDNISQLTILKNSKRYTTKIQLWLGEINFYAPTITFCHVKVKGIGLKKHPDCIL